MAITGNSSFVPTMNQFAGHWALCNTALSPAVLLVGMPDNTSLSQVQFVALRDTLLGQQSAVQDKLNDVEIARADIEIKKAQLLVWLNQFNGLVEAYYGRTVFVHARPKAPSIGDGQENFTRPLVDAMSLWGKINAAPAPAGVTLPLTLADGTAVGNFSSAVSTLQFAYATLANTEQNLQLARLERDAIQEKAYAAMKAYRVIVPSRLAAHPTLVASLPALTPAPGHTPVAVPVSGVFQAPDAAKVVYGASDDVTLEEYQLRGTIGASYEEDDAVVIATNGPGAAREFVTTFGLTQPGVRVSFKVYVILNTGNEAGSATVVIQRPV